MSTVPTEVERHLIHEYIILPLLITTIENNIDRMKSGTAALSLHSLFTGAATMILDQINADLTDVRKALRSLNIKVWEDKAKFGMNNSLHYRYTCRGYEHELVFLRDSAKADLGVRLGKYSKIIEDRLTARK